MTASQSSSPPFLFLISPTKTMRKTARVGLHNPSCIVQSDTLLAYLKQLDEPSLQAYLEVNPQISQLNYQRLHAPSDEAIALDAYHGAQFKALDSESLSVDERLYLQERLRILSGLYGLLKPFDRIRLYRLPMGHAVLGVKLSHYWRPVITPLLEPYRIVNLASQEYAEALDATRIKMLEVRFQKKVGGKLKTSGMDAKRLRGAMVRFAAQHTVQSIEDLKAFQSDGYAFDVGHSSEDLWVFSK
ncbi:MAG: YaaA family protein [Acholeplasmatales bacterium]|nr:MAG: YaaA family protein [Acholeplasmatales bacterium]